MHKGMPEDVIEGRGGIHAYVLTGMTIVPYHPCTQALFCKEKFYQLIQ